jgi:hydroxyacylglutathione hydrolase
MFELTFYTGGIAQTNGWLLRAGNESIVIDAPEGMASWVRKQGVAVTQLWLTHQHFDHVMDAAEIARDHHCSIVAHSAYTKALTLELLFAQMSGMALNVPPFVISDQWQSGALLTGLGRDWQVFHIPGHSPDSICFYQAEWGLLLAGDVLMDGGVGRCDFPGGSEESLISGIHQHLLGLPELTRVIPGHGSETTIGWENQHNPYL